jgi:diguanylate cyclase (GGDEF)-like protein/PAS domain S-box-containing protein
MMLLALHAQHMSNPLIRSSSGSGVAPLTGAFEALHPRLRAQLTAVDHDSNPSDVLAGLLPTVSASYQQLDEENRQVRRAMQSLADESRYQGLVHQSSEAVLVVDSQTLRCVDANELALRFFGIKRVDLGTLDAGGLLAAAKEGRHGHEDGDSDTTGLSLSIDRPRIFDWRCTSSNGVPLLAQVRLTALPGISGLLRACISDASASKRDQLVAAGDRDLFQQIASDVPLPALLASVVTLIENVCNDCIAAVSLLRADGQGVEMLVGAKLPESIRRLELGAAIDAEVGSAVAAMHLGRQVLATDIGSDPHWIHWRTQAAAERIEAAWAVPIKDSGGTVLGAVTVYSHRGGFPATRDLELFLHAGRLAAIAIERSGAGRQERPAERRVSAGALPLGSVELERAQETLRAISDAVITVDANGRIDFVNPMAEQLCGWSALEARGLPADQVLHFARELDRTEIESPLLRSLRDGTVVEQDGQSLLTARSGSHVPVQFSAAPIRAQSGKIVGAVTVFREVTLEQHLRRALSYQAMHDPLTGLINRREFEARLEAVVDLARSGEGVHALLYVDLDGFKGVNEQCGVAAGDRLLRDITLLLQQQVRSADTVARIGGDEFGIITQYCTTEQAIRVADGIRQAVQNYRLDWEVHSARVSASIGAVSVGRDSGSAASLLSAAESACFAARDAGRNRIHVYDAGESTGLQRDLHWVGVVSRAVEEGRLELHEQPIIATSAAVQRMQFHELLTRLRGVDNSLVLPADFVPAAERYNLMSAIDRWVVKRAVELLSARAAHDLPPTMLFAINISASSFCDRSFLDYLLALTEGSVLRGGLCLELAENAVISNLTQAADFMNALKRRGCRFTLDNFGSGLFSLQVLKTLPLDFLKIDGQCTVNIVNDPVDRGIVEAIIKVASSLGIATIAERVESGAVRDVLEQMQVDYMQGFLLGRPKPLDALAAAALRG